MSDPDGDQRELDVLRSCVRDLSALATLPVVWTTGETTRILESLAEALLSMQRLDFVYICLRSADGPLEVEVGRTLSDASAEPVGPWLGRRLLPWLENPDTTPVPGGNGLPHALRGLLIPFGLDGSRCLLAAGSVRPTFPSETERLLMRVGANQAALILARQRKEGELRAKDAYLLDTEKRRAALLAQVADASRAINAELSVDAILQVLTAQARAIIGSHQAVSSLTIGNDWAQSVTTVSLSDKYARFRSYDARPTGQGTYAEVCRTNRPVRLTQEELLRHPLWRGFGEHAPQRLPLRGWLVVPLVGHGGRNLGLVQLSDKYDGEFTPEDEAVLQQLAATAAVGIQNARLYEQLKQQDSRKDEFLAMLAHELRNPLAPVRTGIDLLRAQARMDAAGRETCEMMGRQVGHMVRLIDDLMDVSRISRGKLNLRVETLALRAVFDAALETGRPLVEAAGHRLRVVPPDDMVFVDADLTRLAQVLGNLLANAAKYTPAPGEVELSAERRGGEVLVRVRDSGIGIAPDMLSNMFGLFVQGEGSGLARAHGGLGIGLALAKSLVEMHGGSITAESDGPGQGSIFTVRLPTVASEPAKAAAAAATPDGAAPFGLRVLVVDDNVDAAETFAMLLALHGHEVRVAHTGRDALDAASLERPDVVFLDIGLPGMTGYEVARSMRGESRLAGVTIVAVTGWGSESDRSRSRAAGFDHHLTKPVETSAAEALLRDVVNQRRSNAVVT